MSTPSPAQPKILAPGEGRKVVNASETAILKLTSAETAGQFMFAEIWVEPGNGPPYHVHELEDELFIVQEGEVIFTLDGQSTRLGAGAVVFAARNVPHMFRGAGEQPARLWVLSMGSSLEVFFARWRAEKARPSSTPESMAELAKSFGITFLPTPETS